MIDKLILKFEKSGPSDEVKMCATCDEYDNYWIIYIAYSVGRPFSVDEFTFEVRDIEGYLQYRVTLDDSNPDRISQNKSIIYPIPSNSTPVWDNTTGKIVTSKSLLQNYSGCYAAYLDRDGDGDGKVSHDDEIWVFKDYDADGNDDINTGFTFGISDDNGELIYHKKL